MAQSRTTLMEPPIEGLLDKVDSKFTLVALSAKRGRQINSYYNQLGEGLGYVVPPQVTSISGKSLTIAFEEIAAGKAVAIRREPGEELEEGAEDADGADGTDGATGAEGVALGAEVGEATGEPAGDGAGESVAEDAAEESAE